MADPRLRILLVDEEHSRRMNIEKNLAGLGYSRVAPLASLRELLSVIDNALHTFDLLVINQPLLSGAGPISEQWVRNCPDIRHLLVYQEADLQFFLAGNSANSSMNFSLSCLPDQQSIRQVMSFVDQTEGSCRHAVHGN